MTAKRNGPTGPGDADTDGAPVPDTDGAPAPIPASYEQARDELSDVVTALEEGGLSLDESLALWERGQALAAACETFLAGARARIDRALAASDDREGSPERG